MRRPRGPGGRFLTGDEIRALEAQEATQQGGQNAPQTQQSRPKSSGTNGKSDEAAPADNVEA